MKKTHPIINHQNKTVVKPDLTQNVSEKDRLIHFISSCSNYYGDKLLDFMDKYHLTALKDATEFQLKEFIALNPFLDPTREKTRI